MSEEKVFFDNGRGVRLCGLFQQPSPEAPVVILAHGFLTSKRSGKYEALAPALAEAGLGSLRFDFFGHGESEGAFADITLTEGVADVAAAAAYVRSRTAAPVGFFGASFGGAACFYAAPSAKPALVLLACPAILYYRRWVKELGEEGVRRWRETGVYDYPLRDGSTVPLNYSFFESLDRWDGVATAPTLPMPVHVIHGEADQLVDVKDSEEVVPLLPRGSLEVWPGTDHLFKKDDEPERLTERVVGWFSRHWSTGTSS